MKKLFWIAFVFVFTLSFVVLTNFTIFFEAPHSEGLIMLSDIGETILGIDFVKEEFIYPRPREKKILPFLSIIKQDFYPFLKLRLFGVEIPLTWKDYHGILLMNIVKVLDKIFFFIGEFWKLVLKAFVYHFINSFFLLYFLFRLLERYFFIDRFITFSLIFCVLTLPVFYFFVRMHHPQPAIFILGMLYFLMEGRYVLAGIFGGLAAYSYLPITFAVLGLTLTSLLYHRSFKGVILISLFFLIFTSPSLYYIFSSQGEDFHQVYNCSNCIVFFPPKEIKVHFREDIRNFFNLFEVLVYLLFSVIFLPLNFSDILGSVFSNLKDSFSVSDVMLGYGYFEGIQDFKYKGLAEVSILLNLLILGLGILYIMRRFEVVAYIFSLIFYVLLSRYFTMVPKMIYILSPIYFLISVRVINEFLMRRKKILVLIFFISCFLRLAEFIDIAGKVKASLRWKENKEVVDFFKDKYVKSEDILLYSLPVAFKIFSEGRLNPPVFLLVFEKLDPLLRKKTMEFVIYKSNFKYLVFDINFTQHLYDILERDKENLKIVFKNEGFIIVEIKRNNQKR
ncbi:MAG: hypothetical protein ACO2PO_10600 [Candidatus Calescibacterium sp.]